MSLPKGPTAMTEQWTCPECGKAQDNKLRCTGCGYRNSHRGDLTDPVHTDEGKWWFWTDDGTEARQGPFNHEHEARQELAEWIAFEKDLRGDPQ